MINSDQHWDISNDDGNTDLTQEQCMDAIDEMCRSGDNANNNNTGYIQGPHGLNGSSSMTQQDDRKNGKFETEVTRPVYRSKASYQCTHCHLFTRSARVYLYHQVNNHQAKINIYSCKICDYSCQFKYRVARHMRLVHNMNVPLVNIVPEYVGNPSKPQPASSTTSVLASRSTASACSVSGETEQPALTSQLTLTSVTQYPRQYTGKPNGYMTSTVTGSLADYIVMEVTGYLKPFMCTNCGLKSNKKYNIKTHIDGIAACKDASVIALKDIPDLEEDLLDVSGAEQNEQLLEKSGLEIADGSGSEKDDLSNSGENKGLENRSNADKGDKFVSEENLLDMSSPVEMIEEPVDVSNSEQLSITGKAENVKPYCARVPKRKSKSSGKNLKQELEENANKAPRSSNIRWKCAYCPYVHERKLYVRQHLMRHNRKAFSCTGCNFQSNQNLATERHIEKCHQNTSATVHENMVLQQPDIRDRFPCKICPFVMFSQNALSVHMMYHMPRPGVEYRKCKFCPYYIKTKKLLMRHQRLHEVVNQQSLSNSKRLSKVKKSATRSLRQSDKQLPRETSYNSKLGDHLKNTNLEIPKTSDVVN